MYAEAVAEARKAMKISGDRSTYVAYRALELSGRLTMGVRTESAADNASQIRAGILDRYSFSIEAVLCSLLSSSNSRVIE